VSPTKPPVTPLFCEHNTTTETFPEQLSVAQLAAQLAAQLVARQQPMTEVLVRVEIAPRSVRKTTVRIPHKVDGRR